MSKYRKFLVALGGIAAQVIPALALTGVWAKVAAALVAALTAVGVVAVPNSGGTP